MPAPKQVPKRGPLPTDFVWKGMCAICNREMELPFYRQIGVDTTCPACSKEVREELGRVTNEALLEMSQGELEEWIDPGDAESTFRRLSDLVRNKRPKGSAGAVIAKNLGICPHCSSESCDHQCWSRKARKGGRDGKDGERADPLGGEGLSEDEWRVKIENLLRLRGHLNLTTGKAMVYKRRGDLPALWSELCRKYQCEEASATAIGAPDDPGTPPPEPRGAAGSGEYHVPCDKCPEPNNYSLDYIASYKKLEGKTHHAYWLRSAEKGLCIYAFEGDERTQFFCKKYPRDTSVPVTQLNNRMVKFTYARTPVGDDRPERVWT